MFEDLLAVVQPQTAAECKECLGSLKETENSLLSMASVSPMQLVFGRNPEVPCDLLNNTPDLVAQFCTTMEQVSPLLCVPSLER